MVLKSFVKCLLGKKSLPDFMMESIEVTFHLKNVPATITQVSIYGSSPELGNWQLSQAVQMTAAHSEYQATLALYMSSYPYYYKYVTLDENNQPVAEKGANRLVCVRDDTKPLDIHDAWRFRVEVKEGEGLNQQSQRRSVKLNHNEPIQYRQPISQQTEKEQQEKLVEEMRGKLSQNDLTRLTQAMEMWIQTKQQYEIHRYTQPTKETYSIFDLVPQEVLDYIFKFTLTSPTIEDSAKDMNNISLVSKRFARIMLTESIYKHLTVVYWPNMEHNVQNSSWRFVLLDLYGK